MPMEFRQLEYFIAVAEELSFARAAARLNISQPAVSRQIALLEEELNTVLFDVTQKVRHKRVVLTEEGSYFYQEAVKILRQSKEMTEGLERLRTRRKTVNVGYCAGLPGEGVTRALHFLQQRLAAFELKLTVFDSPYEMYEAIRKDEILFGTGLDTGGIPAELGGVVLQEGRVQVCIAAGHPLAQEEHLGMHQLKNEKWIECSALPTRFSDRPSQKVPDFGVLAGLAELGMGLGAIPSFYDMENPGISRVDLISEGVNGRSIPCRQTLLFRRNGNSSIVRQVQASC